MRMPEVGTRIVNVKMISERHSWMYRTLGYKRNSVHVRAVPLVMTMPVYCGAITR
jgi:hypothetical protein